jgi:hypothetical protein
MLTHPIQFGGDRQIQQFIRRAVSLRSNLCAKDRPDALANALGGEQPLREYVDQLDNAILSVLAFYGPETQIVEADRYFASLATLAGGLQGILTKITQYEKQHRTGIDGSTLTADTGSVTESTLFRETLGVALEIAKVLAGRK